MLKTNEMERSKFWSINGQNLLVHINKSAICLSVIIASSYKSLCIKVILLVLLVALDSVFLLGNFTSMYFIVGCLFITTALLYSVYWTTIRETLTVMKGLGVQIETKYVVGSKSFFIPADQLQQIFINEVIFRDRVLFILTLLIVNANAKEMLIPLFVESLPQLSLLELVLNNIKKDELMS